jgi:hypothetical protein
VPYATDTITLGLATGPGGSLTGGGPAAPVNGIATFNNLELDMVGSGYVLQASASLPTPTVNSSAITVTAGGIDHFTVSLPSSVTAASGFSASVTAYDGGNNVITSYTGTVTISTNDAGPCLAAPSNYTFTGGDAGVASISGFTFSTVGSRSVTVTDGSASGIGSTTVNNGSANHLHIYSMATSATVGTPVPFSVHAKDSCDNIDTGYNNTLAFSSDDTSATLPAPAPMSSGNYSGNVTFNAPGTFYFHIEDAGNSSINDQQNNIVVGP